MARETELGAGATGSYTWDLATDVWWWSPELYLIHGYPPDSVTPTTELFLAHKHDDDRERVAAAMERVRRTGRPFSCWHRVVCSGGAERVVVMVGAAGVSACADDNTVTGCITDVTGSCDGNAAEDNVRLRRQLAAMREGFAAQALIEQAKGMIMLSCGCEAAMAWQALARVSQATNVKIRDLAPAVIALLSGLVEPQVDRAVGAAIQRELTRLKSGRSSRN
ncbi:PAS and ANTAR domain-containing protein [Salinactinospora qingdaonensis]|uniref:ANTAR domain-containing protein n=1 Tax=Salinactinospora qingdaonensis TaxID=702744 RepID=A0ABP7FKD3_9ACTN